MASMVRDTPTGVKVARPGKHSPCSRLSGKTSKSFLCARRLRERSLRAVNLFLGRVRTHDLWSSPSELAREHGCGQGLLTLKGTHRPPAHSTTSSTITPRHSFSGVAGICT